MNTPGRPEDTAVVPMVVVPRELVERAKRAAAFATDVCRDGRQDEFEQTEADLMDYLARV